MNTKDKLEHAFGGWIQQHNKGLLRVGALTVGVGTVAGLRWLNERQDRRTNLSNRTQQTLRKAQQYVVGALTLTSIPCIVARQLGPKKVTPFYTTLLGNKWVGLALFSGSVVLAAVTWFYPNKPKKRVKKTALWAATCLTAGFWLAPVFLLPRSFIVLAGGYTAALALPLAVTTVVAKDWIFFNLAAPISMFVSAQVVRHMLKRFRPISSLLLGVVCVEGILMLLDTNLMIAKIENTEEPDVMNLSLQISAGVIRTYVRLIREILKIISGKKQREIVPEKKKEKKTFWRRVGKRLGFS